MTTITRKHFLTGTLCLLAIAGLLSVTSPASAAILSPGTSQTNPDAGVGTFYSTTLPALGALLAQQVTPFNQTSGNLTGSVTSSVYANAGGGLTFTYQFTSTGSNELVRATIADGPFAGITIQDAGSDGSGSSTPAGVPNWIDGDPFFIEATVGGGVAFQWRVFSTGTQLNNGDVSAVVFLETDAQNWQLVTMGLSDSGATADAQVLAPSEAAPPPAPIPEPASLLLWGGLASIGLALRRRARRRTA